MGLANRFFFPRPQWWADSVAQLSIGIFREGLGALIMSSLEGSHVADDVAQLVLNESCRGVGRSVSARARELQESVAASLGVTLIEESEFYKRMRK